MTTPTRPRRHHRSSQRDAILEFVRQCASHPTAEEIFAHLKRRFPRLSLGTVYRNLHILAETGAVRALRFGSGRDRYDAVTTTHYHFICRRCEELIDVAMTARPDLEAEARSLTAGSIEGHSVVFHGLCTACLRAQDRPGRAGPPDRTLAA